MKKRPSKKIEKFRIKTGPMGSDARFGNNGFFLIPYSDGNYNDLLKVMISDGEGWDHVSVSLEHRTPTWSEMCFVKDLFFNDDETVIQYHPPKANYINNCEYCLHLWKKQNARIKLPPSYMVGFK